MVTAQQVIDAQVHLWSLKNESHPKTSQYWAEVTNGLVVINPEIIESSGTQTGEEGCLSVKGKYGTVTRAETVKVKAQNRKGEPRIYTVSGFTARAFQHEIDHLNGIVYVSKVEGELKKGWEYYF